MERPDRRGGSSTYAMQYSFLIEIDGAIVRVIAPVFASDRADARRQAADWLDLFPADATLSIVHEKERVAVVSR